MMRFSKLILVTVLLITGSSCYDGWDPVAEKAGPGGTEKPPENVKPVYYIKLTKIYLSSAALDDPTCFGATGTEDFREMEWIERRYWITEDLSLVGERFVSEDIQVPAADCNTSLATIETAALTLDKNLLDLPDDPLDRPIWHVKAVFFDGDMADTPSAAVSNRDWATQRILAERGRRSRSFYYLSQSGTGNGYFSKWYKQFPALARFIGTPINTIDPTDGGIAARKELAKSDASDLTNALLRTLGSEN